MSVELSLLLNLFTPFATVFNASISNPESVSSNIANFGFKHSNCRISLFFFSPPEKPSLIDRFKNESSRLSSLNIFFDLF